MNGTGKRNVVMMFIIQKWNTSFILITSWGRLFRVENNTKGANSTKLLLFTLALSNLLEIQRRSLCILDLNN